MLAQLIYDELFIRKWRDVAPRPFHYHSFSQFEEVAESPSGIEFSLLIGSSKSVGVEASIILYDGVLNLNRWRVAIHKLKDEENIKTRHFSSLRW